MRLGSLIEAASATVPERISGKAKVALFDGQDQIAGQRQFQPAAAADPVDCADHGLVEVGQFLQPAKTADPIVAIDRVARGGGLQIPAGAEELVALGPQDADAQTVVVAKGAKDQRP